MALGLKLAAFFALQTLLLALFMNRSPYTMVATPPTDAWADQPMRLITTPQFETQKTDLFTTGATHMCLLHNSIIRGFNSIYLQAPHVQDVDRADFVAYARTWYKFVKSHHDDEEKSLFNKVEDILSDKEILAETHEEHESFMPGLLEFNNYLTNLKNTTTFSGTELIRIMDTFRHPFEHHFHHEIAIIAALSSHPNVPVLGTHQARNASVIFKKWGKGTVTKAGISDVTPFFLMNLDRTAEGGMWASWPPMPRPIRWGLVNVAGSWQGNRLWKFASCDKDGEPRELFALSKTEKA